MKYEHVRANLCALNAASATIVYQSAVAMNSWVLASCDVTLRTGSRINAANEMYMYVVNPYFNQVGKLMKLIDYFKKSVINTEYITTSVLLHAILGFQFYLIRNG